MHKLVRRVKPAMTAAPTTTPAEVRTRNLRMTSNRRELADKARQTILEKLKSIAECDEAIDRVVAEKDAALAQIEELMREHKIPLVEDGKLLAEIKETFSRQSSTVDPKKFRNKVTADQFWKCIEVIQARAKDYLGAKELASISDIVPSKSTGYRLNIREIQKRK